MSGIFVFKAERDKNYIEYVPYFDSDNNNEDYEIFNVDEKIKKIGSSRQSDVICQDNVSNYFVRKALGLEEQEYYNDEEDEDSPETITVGDEKGADIIVIWTDTKQDESNRKKRLQSLRGFSGIYIKEDKQGNKFFYIDVICNAPSSGKKLRKANIKKRGKEIINLIEELAKAEKVNYIALRALDNVITYYHKLGYKLVQHHRLS